MTSVRQSDWRKWACMQILYINGMQTTAQLLQEIEQMHWDVLPVNGRMEAIHDILKRESQKDPATRRVKIFMRFPIRWGLTPIGRLWALEYLFNNSNITPAKSREEGAYRRL